MKAIESVRLVELEKVISAGKKTFVSVGRALSEIRDSKLYRDDYDTFEAYCKGKWGWERRYAYNLIESASVVESLPHNVRHGTQINERQARELARIEPEKRVEVLEEASSNGDLTAKSIRIAAQNYEPGISRMKPISADAEHADEESDCLYQLKRWWKKATKRDHKAFCKWAHLSHKPKSK